MMPSPATLPPRLVAPPGKPPGRARSAVCLTACAIAAAAAVSLLGHLSGNETLSRLVTDGGPLAGVTALALLLSAMGLWLSTVHRTNRAATREERRPGIAAWVRRLFPIALTIGGLVALAAYFLLSGDRSATLPTRPGIPGLCAAFALLGCGLLLSRMRTPHRIWAQVPLFPVLWVSLLIIMARFYGIQSINPYLEFLLFPVQTAVPLGVLAAGTLLLHPREGILGVVTSRHSGGVLARVALPLMLLMPFTVGWIRMEALRSGFHDLAGAFAQFSTTNTFIFCGFILFSAHVLNRMDARRQETLESLRAANAELEARIAEQRRAEAAREESERQLFQAQKMEAMGVLASGIAHDFNNILTVILLNAEEAEEEAGANTRLRASLGEVRRSGERAAGLIRQIMAFGRNEPGEHRAVSLSEVIAETADVLRPALPAGIKLQTATAANVPDIQADAGQLRQVLLNLANNALHAMEGLGGTLEIHAETSTDPEPLPPTLTARGYVRVTVRDTGHGMDAETAKRIFDPFFTTKPPGKGTGLGLSVVHGIVKLHGGVVTVRSEPGQGTEFRLYLPAISDE